MNDESYGNEPTIDNNNYGDAVPIICLFVGLGLVLVGLMAL